MSPAGALTELSPREREVLEAIVHGYIESNEPVGSKRLAGHPRLNVSPATIRAVMGVLGERGLIEKPHSSAGRIPTDAGFRYFVDCLLKLTPPERAEREEIEARLLRGTSAVDDALEEASAVLARLSHQACILRAPRSDGVVLKLIELVALRQDAALCILVTADGRVQNRLIEAGPGAPLPPPAELRRMASFLTEWVAGKTLQQAQQALGRAMERDQAEMDALKQSALALAERALSPADVDRVHVHGEANLLAEVAPEALPKMRALMETLEEKTAVAELLARAQEAPGVRVFIGQENATPQMEQMALVSATYGPGDQILGSIGVIGPTRLDYGRVVPLVEFTAHMVSRILSG